MFHITCCISAIVCAVLLRFAASAKKIPSPLAYLPPSHTHSLFEQRLEPCCREDPACLAGSGIHFHCKASTKRPSATCQRQDHLTARVDMHASFHGSLLCLPSHDPPLCQLLMMVTLLAIATIIITMAQPMMQYLTPPPLCEC